MRSLLLLIAIGCGGGERPPPDPGSRVELPSHRKPPKQTARALDKAALAKLAALDLAGFTRVTRKLDDGFLDVALAQASPPIRVSVVIQPCLRCLPMQIDRWRAESDALRVMIPPDVRDRAGTTFEVAATTIDGAPAIWTYHSTEARDHAVTLYWNDGVNQIRTIASFEGAAVERRDLERVAAAIAARYTQAWAD